jgi:flagellar biosynthesis/type III secretory pathway M-ring protein FliF/YscJ
MSIWWNIFFWLALVAVAGIIAWTIVRVVTRNGEVRKYVADAQNGGDYKVLAEQGAATNSQVLERLGTIEAKLAAIEKTLTEIP